MAEPLNSDEVILKITDWCKTVSIKELARLLAADERTVKSWRSGNMPNMVHFLRMVDLWGMSFVEDVLSPVLVKSDDQILNRLSRISSEITNLTRIIRNRGFMLLMIAFTVAFMPVDDGPLRVPRPPVSKTRKD